MKMIGQISLITHTSDELPSKRSRSREAERGHPLRHLATTPFASPRRRIPQGVGQRFQPDGYVNTPFTVPAPTPVAAPFGFSAPAATPTGATNLPPVPDDDDMGQGDECGFVYNPPVLPDPPSFNGSTKSERTFIHQYNKYQDQVNALQLNGSRPFVMAVSACMDIFTKNRVAMWDMANRDYCGDTEAAWAAWFGKVFEQESQDLEVLKKRLTTAIRFDTPILDADSRIGTMLDNLMRALECDEQAWVLDQESKTVVDIMVKGIKPLGLQMTVQHQLALQHKKPLKTNVCRFVDWLRVHTAGYHLYAPVDDEKTSAKYERKKATSLKCARENHKVVNCPKCAPGQCERLLKEQINKWESARNKKVTKLQGSANKSLGREAKIEGIVFLTTTLLDTGSDVTLVTAGVMK
ncbi:hypothetical protein DYB30_008335, partial [Aphanomyces astaci]